MIFGYQEVLYIIFLSGYSVTSGRFWNDQEMIVAGAPRASLSGRVSYFFFVFKYSFMDEYTKY